MQNIQAFTSLTILCSTYKAMFQSKARHQQQKYETSKFLLTETYRFVFLKRNFKTKHILSEFCLTSLIWFSAFHFQSHFIKGLKEFFLNAIRSIDKNCIYSTSIRIFPFILRIRMNFYLLQLYAGFSWNSVCATYIT
jgi:hypothetical protein